MSITCNVCGTVNPEGTEYCEGCGVELQAPSAQVNTPPQRPTEPQNTYDDDRTLTPDDFAGGSSSLTPMPEATPEAEPLRDAKPNRSPNDMDFPPRPDDATMPASETPFDDIVNNSPSWEEPVPVDPRVTVHDSPSPHNMGQGNMGQDDMGHDNMGQGSMDTGSSRGPVIEEPFEEPFSPSPSTPASSGNFTSAKLVIKRFGAVTSDSVPLQGDQLIVGRFDPSTGPVDVDVTGLPGAEHISRRHAEIFFDGRWRVRDLGSTNGVFVKRAGEGAYGPRLQAPAPLHDGDEVAFGNVVFVFREEE